MKLVKICLIAIIFTTTAATADTVFKQDGVAIKGFDAVSYHKTNTAREGNPQHWYQWKGAKWLLSSSANRDLFATNPAQYAPEYGGYCAYAASKGSLAPIDPYAWTIHDGRLYLNYSKQVRSIWQEDIPENIKKADTNWPNLSSQ